MTTRPFNPTQWGQLAPHVDCALDLEPAAREEYIAELEQQQPEIGARVRQFLNEYEALKKSPFLESGPLLAQLEPPSLAGQRVGAYTIDRLLGRGGMGEVWLASRSDGRFEGRCAIKFLAAMSTHPRLLERFRQEAALLARLGHSNIARLFDAGATEDGKQFLLLEYIDGVRIDHYCDLHELTVDARVRVFVDAIAAVAHAHSQLVVHRDLKPSNVLVTRDGVVKLLDFGVAKLLSTSQPPGADAVTRVEDIALTPEYAAPEQLLGEPPSTASDIYQLGMLLYVLLARRHPIQQSGNRAEHIKATLNGTVPRASDLTDGALRKQLLGDLDAILAKAMHPEVSHRYSTAEALREDLMRYLNREPVNARGGTALYRARKFVGRHRVAVIASATAIASLCTMALFSLNQAHAARMERDRAVIVASRNSALTEFLKSLIIDSASADKPVTVTDMLARSERLALAAPTGNHESDAAILETIAEHYDLLGEHVKAMHLLERALESLRDSPERDLRSKLACEHAFIVATQGQLEEALQEVMREVEHPAADPDSVATCLRQRSNIAGLMEDAPGALRYATAALDYIRANGAPSEETKAKYLTGVAAAQLRNGRNSDAIEDYRQVLHIYETVHRENSPAANLARNNAAVASVAAGVPKQALQLYDDMLRLRAEREPGAEPPVYLLVNRASVLQLIGRSRDAFEEYQRAQQLAAHVQNREAQANALIGLAQIAIEMTQPDVAETHLASLATLLGSSDSAPSTLSGRVAMTRGELALALGRLDEAQQYLEGATIRGRARPAAVTLALDKAEVWLRMGRAGEALASAQEALSIAVSLQGGVPFSNRTGLAWLLIGQSQQALGDDTAARAAFQRAIENLSATVDATHPALMRARELASAASARA